MGLGIHIHGISKSDVSFTSCFNIRHKNLERIKSTLVNPSNAFCEVLEWGILGGAWSSARVGCENNREVKARLPQPIRSHPNMSQSAIQFPPSEKVPSQIHQSSIYSKSIFSRVNPLHNLQQCQFQVLVLKQSTIKSGMLILSINKTMELV